MKQIPPPDGYALASLIFKRVNDLRVEHGLKPYTKPKVLYQLLGRHNVPKTPRDKCSFYYDLESSMKVAQRAIDRTLSKRPRPEQNWKGNYALEMKNCETDTHVSSRSLYEMDKALRSQYGIRPRANIQSFQYIIYRKNIRSFRTPNGHFLWDVEHFYDVFVPMYEERGYACSRRSDSSIELSHLTATPDILKNPNYLPKAAAAKAAGINKERFRGWVESMKIIPYYVPEQRLLLYPVDKAKELAPWRPMHFIQKHYSRQECDKLRKTRKSKPMFQYGQVIARLYYVPELAHL